MSRGSFSRTVARAAAAGGGKSYRARPAYAWFTAMIVIIVLGVFLVVFSRHERLHPVTEGPHTADHWKVALAFDICGTMQPNLAANTTLTTGLRTFGDGLIDVDPSAATTPSNFTGKKATLGLFAKNYTGLTLTTTSVKLPGKGQTLHTNGAKCGTAVGKVQAKVWASPTAKGKVLTTNPLNLHLENGQMITIAFVPAGATIPEPPAKSRSALSSFLNGGTSSSSSSTTSTSSSSTTTTTAKSTGSTTTTAAKSTTTT